ncbi:minor tail protein [Mycobacterium phage Gattaca]|uniref:Minor tail protein n=1 Tax=Mycobacterium phage Gattaca TaxID=1852567 RepID=A0A192Y9L4_9CAUD|nr:minor tail protein [Mycobacterium phage Gattaca]
MPTLADLEIARPTIHEHRRRKKALKQAMPSLHLWVNPPDGETGDGLMWLGRVDLRDAEAYEFPFKNNEPSAGTVTVRADHYIAKKVASIPNDPDMCKNVVITVDLYGGTLRWSGLMHHWTVNSPEGSDYITLSFNDDLQFLDFMLAPPNPALPIPIFQFPRVWPMFGPTRWCVATLILLQIIRLEGHPWTLPDDPFDLEQWFDLVNWGDWQVHVKGVSFLTDDSLWTLLASRMNTVTSVIADALDDAQLTIVYRRIMRNWGETVTGLLDNNVKHGALVFEIVDRSGWALPEGTFFEGTAAAGFFRSVLTWGSGFIEDSLTMVTTTDELYPDEYYQTSWMSTLAAAPGVVVRDSRLVDLQSEVSHSPPTAVSVVVGGDNPAADAIARLIIESVGNLLGYFLLAGFDSLGDMAADIIMPFLVGTILAWDEWKNFARADSLGWVHLHEIYQQGAENNAWSLAALAAMRGGFKATGTQTSHTMVIGDSMWTIPGIHFNIGDRIGSTAGALQRLGIDMIFVNQVEEMTLRGKGVEREFLVRCGKNKAVMTMGERMARLMKKALDTLQNIGVHLIS